MKPITDYLLLSCVLLVACASAPTARCQDSTSPPVDPSLKPGQSESSQAESGTKPAPVDGKPAWNLPPEVPRPDFLSRNPFLPDLLLKDKREGWYFAGFPAIGWDDEQGFNLGAVGELFNNGSRDDPFFRSTPYRSKVAMAAVFSSEGVARVFAVGDMPYIFESPYRLRVGGGVILDPINNYFGIGEDSLRPLNFPGAPGQEFSDFDDYADALEERQGGFTYANYNLWKSKEYPVAILVERDFLGGILRPLVGVRLAYTEISDYTGDEVDASGGDAIQQPTKLLEDHLAGRIEGFDGGWDNSIKLGLSFDTRDFEPDPSSGIIAQVSSDISTRVLGSYFDYQRITYSVSGYRSLIPARTRLIFAGRAVYSMQFGEVPFFAMNSLAFNTLNREGLGGFQTLRGYKRNRFIGESAVLLNAELRWSFAEWKPWNQHLRPMLVPFVEAGRVHDDVDLQFDDWKMSYGFGFRLGWNLSTIVSFDLGFSEEGMIFYLELGHSF